MIPIRIVMCGWMRYREESAVDFSGGSLFAICGENGAGKSAIFDAIVFALYGKHRLGANSYADLISEGADSAAVEFEFEAEGQRYMVKRQRDRTGRGGTQGLWIADGDGWAAVAGTDKVEGLDRQVERIVRLSFAAFTSSFMLQQNDATAFIEAKPKARFEIIGSLLALDEYQWLEKAARERAKETKAVLDHAKQQIDAIGEAGDEALGTLQARCDALAAAATDAAEILTRAKVMAAEAARYTRLAAHVATLDAAITAAQGLLDQREAIEEDARLFQRFAEAVEDAAAVRDALAGAAAAGSAADEARRRAEALDVPAMEEAVASAAGALNAAAAAAQTAERAHGAAQEAERDAAAFAQQADEITGCRKRVAEVEQRLAALQQRTQALAAAGRRMQKAAREALAAEAAAERALESTRRDAADAKARVDALRQDLAERKAAAKEATCKRCGQQIDRAAAKRQVEELTAGLADASGAATHAAAAAKDATAAKQAATGERAAADQALAAHSAEAARVEGEAAAAEQDHARTAGELADRESRLDGRLKDVDAADAVLAAARGELALARDAFARTRAEAAEAAATVERSRTALETARADVSGLAARIAQQEERAAAERARAASHASKLSTLAEQALADPDGVLEKLQQSQTSVAGAPARKAALERAQSDHDRASGERTAAAAEIRAIAEEHRVDAEAARQAQAEAEAAHAAAMAAHLASQRALASAEARAEQLAALRTAYAQGQLRWQRLRTLEKHLGKKGLQGMLVQDAITEVTSHANAFLHRLTGGTLELKLESSGQSDLLELKAIDHSCMREARSAMALSGSQKFRCAVAIASGIGQYAGAGGMRSIVIDEGFGALDADGQRTIVEELKALAQHMDKVIVVSHLEIFSDPANFPDRLLVTKNPDGSSSVARA